MRKQYRKYGIVILWFLCLTIKAQSPLLLEVNINDTIDGFYLTLHYIEKQTGTQFHYSSIIEPQDFKPIAPGRYTIKQILDTLLDSKQVSYIDVAGAIVLSPKENNTPDYHKIAGTISSEKGEKFVPFANIYIKNTSVGTISNYNGKFQLLVPDSLWGDTLVISAISYEMKKIAIEQYINSKLLVELNIQRIPIKYVLIRPNDAQELVEKAYKNRNKNYNTSTEYMYGFFREYNKQQDNYIAINEAVVNLIKQAYNSAKNDLVSIKKGRKGTNISESKFVNLTVKGGLYNSLQLDIIKYPVPFFSDEIPEVYKFWNEKSTIYNGRSTFVIGFKNAFETEIANYKGRFYIDIETLALVRVEFELDEVGIKKAREILIKKVPLGLKAYPLYAKYVTEYRFYEDKWHFSHAQSEVKIKVKSRKRNKQEKFNSDFVSYSNLVVTGINPQAFPKSVQKTAANADDIFVEQIDELEDKFWEGNNIIIPEKSLIETLKDLQIKGIIGKEHNFISIENTDSILN